MTARQASMWLSQYITWGGEMCADRDALEGFIQDMQGRFETMGKGN